MKRKRLVIERDVDRCIACPWCRPSEWNPYLGNCMHYNGRYQSVELQTIPDTCPLEDADEAERTTNDPAPIQT